VLLLCGLSRVELGEVQLLGAVDEYAQKRST